MPRRCLTCSHPKLKEIDLAIQNNESYRSISRQYEDISRSSITTHAKNHLQPLLKKANRIAEERYVQKIAKLRQEIVYSATEKVRLMQHLLLEEIDQAKKESASVHEYVSLFREFRGWMQEEAKLGGFYRTKWDDPEDWSDEKQATKYFKYLLDHGFGDDRIVPHLTQRFPTVDIGKIAASLSNGSDEHF